MIYQIIPAPESLRFIVKAFWVLEGQGSHIGDYYRLTADPSSAIVFQYKAPFKTLKNNRYSKLPIAFLQGQSSQYVQLYNNENFGVFGVYLQPYALPYLLNTNPQNFKNQRIPLEDIFGPKSHRLIEYILNSRNTQERVYFLTIFLKNNITYSTSQRNNTLLLQSFINSYNDINNFVKQISISRRQFERKFIHNVGLSPKQYCKILRFYKTLSFCNRPQKISLTDLAYVNGYSDQSHFSRDFKEFSGLYPKQYFKYSKHTADSFIQY